MELITNRNWILIPVYNDWESLNILLQKIEKTISGNNCTEVSYLIVDDASTETANALPIGIPDVHLLRLRKNMGHQRAIAIGLSYLNALEKKCKNIIIMDADGEDNPEDIPVLLKSSENNPGKIIFSSRSKRKEGIIFKIGYFFYKILFYLLTAKRISFGNFSLIPGDLLSSVVNISEIWSHYSGGILKADLKFIKIPTTRGKRYSGKSSMSWVALVLHGLRAISVYIDKVAARLLLFFVLICLLLGTGMLVVLYFKFFTELAIPGWATTAMSGLTILLFQALLMSLFIVFIILNQSTQRQIIPAIDYKDYIETEKYN